MKQKLIKLKSASGVSILLLLLSIVGGGNSDINEENISQYLKGDPVSVSNFIEENLGKVVNKYNESSESKDKWEANYIEKKFPILIEDSGEEYQGMFLDFDNDHGYAVVGNEYTFMNFQTNGESPYKNKEGKSYSYSTSTGYFYETDEGMLSVYEENNTNEEFMANSSSSINFDKLYGQEAFGEGKIYDTDEYINGKYGSGWTMYASNSLDMEGFTQFNLSSYVKNKIIDDKRERRSEGNCWFVSAYNVLQYMQKIKWTKMPSSSEKQNYVPSRDEPNFYGWYFDSNGNNISEILTYNKGKSKVHEYELRYSKPVSFPKLYVDVRKCIYDNYGKINDGNIGESSGVIEYVANKYGYYVNAVEHAFWRFYASTGTTNIDSGYPMLWSTLNSNYGSHTMAVCGYKRYSRDVGWWFFRQKEARLFYELRDGHREDPRYFDMTAFSKLFCIGAIVSLSF